MKAKVSIEEGSIRIYTNRKIWRPSQVEPVKAPYAEEHDGEWAVGRGETDHVKFCVEALEKGTLKVFEEVKDAYGNVTPSSVSKPVEMEVGQCEDFLTHDSNAFTVSTGPDADAEVQPS